MITLKEFAENQQIKFGTSGIRALNSLLTDKVCYLFTQGFLQYLENNRLLSHKKCLLAGDLRENTDHLICVIYQAITDKGYTVEYCGKIPTPALCNYALDQQCPAIMVTGSHIASNMNGFKYYTARGEILKNDEQGILSQMLAINEELFDANDQLKNLSSENLPVSDQAYHLYLARYENFFPKNCLHGLRVGLYQHSSVAAKSLFAILHYFGAEVKLFGEQQHFYALDTEALSAEDANIAKKYLADLPADIIVSTDGDGDRPLLSDEEGVWLHGDIIGTLCAMILNAKYVVVPMSCNTEVDAIDKFQQVVRTKIGSPYVIEKMNELIAQDKKNVIGFEANGGVLLGTQMNNDKKTLAALPTRDGILPLICILYYIHSNHIKLSDLVKKYFHAYTASNSIKDISPLTSKLLFEYLQNNNIKSFFHSISDVKRIDVLDGFAIYFKDDTMIYLRQSGNAPELRCYTQANSKENAELLNQQSINQIKKWIKIMNENNKNLILPFIMCGGSGKRLWPLSRSNFPKQFLRLYNAKTLLQNTVMRCQTMDSLLKPIIIGNYNDRFTIASQLAEIDATVEKIIYESISCNTGPAIAIASLWAKECYGDPLMLVMPSDHKIDDISAFSLSIDMAREYALQDKIVTFGVQPLTADSNYGYIKIDKKLNDQAYSVNSFIEKPEKSLAKQLIADGLHFWNTGIFMFKASRILKDLGKFQPDILNYCQSALEKANNQVNTIILPKEIYQKCPAISIDYAIMEKTSDICMVPLQSDWIDIGNWQSLYNIGKKDENNNVVMGDVINIDMKDSYVRTEDRLVTTIGIKNCVIVEARDSILIADKDNLSKMKELSAILEKEHRSEANSSSLVYRPWGYYQVIELSANYQIKKISIFPKQSISLQVHQLRSEHWVILKGKATVTLGHDIHILRPNESIFVPVGTKHRIENVEETNLELIEIQTGSYFGEDDIKRFDDIYQRETES